MGPAAPTDLETGRAAHGSGQCPALPMGLLPYSAVTWQARPDTQPGSAPAGPPRRLRHVVVCVSSNSSAVRSAAPGVRFTWGGRQAAAAVRPLHAQSLGRARSWPSHIRSSQFVLEEAEVGRGRRPREVGARESTLSDSRPTGARRDSWYLKRPRLVWSCSWASAARSWRGSGGWG